MRRRLLPGDIEPPSKGELKRQAQGVQELADRLVDAPDNVLAGLDLPERLVDAVLLARRLPSGGARVRQRQYVAKLMRKMDLEPIRAALERQETDRLQEARLFRRVEGWRDRVLAEGTAAMDELVAECPALDDPVFRKLVDTVLREQRDGGARRSSRELFRAIDRALRAG